MSEGYRPGTDILHPRVDRPYHGAETQAGGNRRDLMSDHPSGALLVLQIPLIVGREAETGSQIEVTLLGRPDTGNAVAPRILWERQAESNGCNPQG